MARQLPDATYSEVSASALHSSNEQTAGYGQEFYSEYSCSDFARGDAMDQQQLSYFDPSRLDEEQKSLNFESEINIDLPMIVGNSRTQAAA